MAKIVVLGAGTGGMPAAITIPIEKYQLNALGIERLEL